MAKKIDGWYNGFNLDIDWFVVAGHGVMFRVFNEGYYISGCRSYTQQTLGM